MAGEHILKCLGELNARLTIGNNWLVRWSDGRTFTVYQHKKYAKDVKMLIETTDEEEACRVLKGE